MNKHICLDCICLFDNAKPKELLDHTGQVDIIIDVCPKCMSNHIEPAEGKQIIILDHADMQHLKMVTQYFINGCKQNKSLCHEPVLHEYYRALILNTENIINNAKQCHKL